MTDTLIPGAEAWSHTTDGDVGALVLHGFTGNPSSMRGLAEAFAAAGFHVEMPRLPGHGTTVEDMLTTDWTQWTGEAEAAYQRLTARTRTVVVAGLSMGGSITLWLAGQHPDIAGLVCVNPATQPQPPEVIAMMEGMIAEGTIVMDGIGSDIADPESTESAYPGTPLPCLLNFMQGLAKLETTYDGLRMPLLLLNSPQDHVVDPGQAEFLATHYGGPIERVSLDRSYHVATQDYDKEMIFSESVAFAKRVTQFMTVLAGVIASIPSPSNGTLSIGPLKIHAYGLMIALGVVVGVWLMGRRFEQKGIGTRDDANSIAVWAVIAGVIGSRLYSVATDWSAEYSHDLGRIPQIWKGGLGIPGGLIGGITVGAYMIRRKGIPLGLALNSAAPGLALAQAVGRWGNYWNQELYGGPTKLPWGLEIDLAHRTGPAAKYATADQANLVFQPTFLYESLLNLLLAGALLWIDRRFKVGPGRLLAMYVLGYGAIRFFVEGLRIDTAHHLGGLRWNQWVALVAVVCAAAYLVITRGRRSTDVETDRPADTVDVDTADDTADGEIVDDDAGDEGVDDDALEIDAEDPDPVTEPVNVAETVDVAEQVDETQPVDEAVDADHGLPSEA